RRRDVPVLISVGYAACHWCHVMAHESFEDAEVAAVVNALTVPVKVDREERPDVDAVYMTATQAMTGQGGWPMTVFATPDGEPFLLRHHQRTGDPASLSMVRHTCERMARGGLYDQLAGGFARYAVDATWTVPHFEKMLYDNALLLRVYAYLWRLTGDPLAYRIAA